MPQPSKPVVAASAAVVASALSLWWARARRGSSQQRAASGPCPYSPRVRLGSKERRTVVVITGACGNLGRKLAAYLLDTYGAAVEVRGVEHPLFCKAPPEGVRLFVGDCARPGGWQRSLDGAHAVVHFSAVNPYPNATWAESGASTARMSTCPGNSSQETAQQILVRSSWP